MWKLAAIERQFPRSFGGCALTPHEVMNQLRLRYDREVEGSERSSLKYIYEGDASPSQSGLVLCVARIVGGIGGNVILELSDGWYSIISILKADNPLQNYVTKKEKIVVKSRNMH